MKKWKHFLQEIMVLVLCVQTRILKIGSWTHTKATIIRNVYNCRSWYKKKTLEQH